jgi:DNA invertase Pin-like site-specific DNA recombinase
LHLYAALAEKERALISARTKEALARKKAQGFKLGNPRAVEAAKLGSAALRAGADQFAANVRPIIESLQAAGITGNKALAEALNARRAHGPRRAMARRHGRQHSATAGQIP